MASKESLYWHDYETTGAQPRRDRPTQFAGVRTDTELNIVGEPLSRYCRLADDIVPSPDACLVTGITPQKLAAEGIAEVDFMREVLAELGKPGTCGVGYNSIRFDDEVTRHALYRNFFDPYAREWQNGNSRWDIIDLVRTARALRPEGIEWPLNADGEPSFRLEDLSVANGISHESAHDALSDVYATIGIARRIRDAQPRLYDFVFTHRRKNPIAKLLPMSADTPVLHISSMYGKEVFNTAPVVPIAKHPVNSNGVIVFDLRHDPGILSDLSADKLRERLFTPREQMPEGVERIPLKVVHINKCPVIVPMSTLDKDSAERTKIDLMAVRGNLQKLSLSAVRDKVAGLYVNPEQGDHTPADVDTALYGGFLGDADRGWMRKIQQTPAADLAALEPGFSDERLPELFFRFRARNYPETLSAEERARWQAFCAARRNDEEQALTLTLTACRERVQELRKEHSGDEAKLALLDRLSEWADAQEVGKSESPADS